ncbi:DNA polymerase III subunits gamma and tau [mine drainage metagenome]|uniref:DNA polymerase III subunits gamma and tau n=1 Tax=mine drainage metagenome TaxID=410659 RepID=A0A1J5QJ10_9ZZZZ
MQLAYTTILHGRNELSLAPDDRTGFTMTLLRLLAFAPVVAGSMPAGGLVLPAMTGGGRGAAAVSAAAAPDVQPKPADAGLARRQAAVPAQTVAEAMPRYAAAVCTPLSQPAALDDIPASLAKSDATSRSAESAQPAPEMTAYRTATQLSAVPAPSRELPAALVIGTDNDWPTLALRLDLPPGLPHALAQQSELVAMDGVQWLLRVPNDQLSRAGALDKLQAAVRAAIGLDIVLRTEAGEVRDSAAQREAKARAQAQSDAEATIHNDPLVQQLMQDLGAQIVPGTLKPLPLSTRPQTS